MATWLRTEIQREKTGSVTVGKSIDGEEVQKYKVFFAGTDANLDDAIYASGVPVFGDSLDSRVLTNKSGDAIDDCSIWMVTCTYTFPQPGEEAKPADPEIERWAVGVTINSRKYEVEAQFDANGNPIANTAADPITGITRPRSDEEMTVSFTSTEVDFDALDLCINKTNSAEFSLIINGQTRTFAENTLLFDDYSISYTLDVTGITYPKQVFRCYYRPLTWTRVVANKGLNQSTGGDKQPITIEDADGNQIPITEPVYLTTDYGDTPPSVTQAAVGAAVEQLSFAVFEMADLFAELLWDIGT